MALTLLSYGLFCKEDTWKVISKWKAHPSQLASFVPWNLSFQNSIPSLMCLIPYWSMDSEQYCHLDIWLWHKLVVHLGKMLHCVNMIECTFFGKKISLWYEAYAHNCSKDFVRHCIRICCLGILAIQLPQRPLVLLLRADYDSVWLGAVTWKQDKNNPVEERLLCIFNSSKTEAGLGRNISQ